MADEDQLPAKRTGLGVLLGTGILAGLIAALLMSFVFILLRNVFGIATPSELIGDRVASALPVDKFLKLLSTAGGYNQLKQLGFASAIVGQLVVGGLGGLLYAFIVERARAKAPDQTGRFGTNRSGLLFIAFFVIALWLVSLLMLWPVLGTHYRGLPPSPATLINAAALLISYAICGVALIIFYGLITRPEPLRHPSPDNRPTARRAVLVAGAGAVIAVGLGALLRRLYNQATFSYDGTKYLGTDLQFITPNDKFYVVTKNVIDPRVERGNWQLEITGMVDRSRVYRFEDLTALPAVTQETTLMCISNEVDGGLMSNAAWKGVPLRSLIEAAGPHAGVKEVFLHGVDNYSDSFSIEKAMEPTTLVVYEMNGEPLPERHGYPVRVIVPGLYGEKNVKWVTRIELVDHDAKGFYERQGWGPNFVIATHSRIDAPDLSKPVSRGTVVPLKGVAFAGDRGVSRVEVSTDGGRSWQDAKITMPGTRLTWAFWIYDWQPGQAGEHKLMVRATDGKGELQPSQERGTVPQGATGYYKIKARVV
ncbi:MAG: molybdopterin-dependent oxidoreductase [Pyrinomonadaceae bacterium]